MVFMRTRYTVAIYMVTFGYVIVAAYKMGMVHERPRGGKPSTLSDAGADSAAGGVDRGSVFEIPEPRVGATDEASPVAAQVESQHRVTGRIHAEDGGHGANGAAIAPPAAPPVA
jgi:hypothetical protein